MNKDTVWQRWMEAILIYGPTAPETQEIEKLYCELYIQENGRLP